MKLSIRILRRYLQGHLITLQGPIEFIELLKNVALSQKKLDIMRLHLEQAFAVGERGFQAIQVKADFIEEVKSLSLSGVFLTYQREHGERTDEITQQDKAAGLAGQSRQIVYIYLNDL
jgi:hypothetical protein